MKKLKKILGLIGTLIGLVILIYKCSTVKTVNDTETTRHEIVECEKSLGPLNEEIKSLKIKINQQIRENKDLKSDIKECEVELSVCESDLFLCEKTVDEGRSSGCYAMELKTGTTVQSGPVFNTSCEGQKRALESTRDFLQTKFDKHVNKGVELNTSLESCNSDLDSCRIKLNSCAEDYRSICHP